MEHSFNNLFLLSHSANRLEGTLVQSTSQSKVAGDQKVGMGWYSSTRYGIKETLEQDLEQCAAYRTMGILDPRLGHFVACLQVCRQHFAARMM